LIHLTQILVMDEKKKILVLGANGKQGNVVAHALIKSGKFKVCCLVKEPHTQRAQILLAKGAHVLQGNPVNIDDVRSAMKNCYGVFNVQNYWKVGVETEYKEGKTVGDAAKELNIQHIIHSSLDYTQKVTGVPLIHANVKAEIEEHFKSLNLPLTVLYLRPFLHHFLRDFAPVVDKGVYVFRNGAGAHTPLALFDVEDLGEIVTRIFENSDKFLGKSLVLGGDVTTMEEFVQTFSKITRNTAFYEYVPIEHIHERARMYESWQKFDLTKDLKIDELKKICPNLHSVESWLQESPYKNIPNLQESIKKSRG